MTMSSVAAARLMVSLSIPSPPSKVPVLLPTRSSLPPPPLMASLPPAPPLRVSLPRPPNRLSSRSPPTSSSLPSPPVRLTRSNPEISLVPPTWNSDVASTMSSLVPCVVTLFALPEKSAISRSFAPSPPSRSSVPVPPSTVSSPSPPNRVSLPARPDRMSLPPRPSNRSAAPEPEMVSLPSREPRTDSTFVSESTKSRPLWRTFAVPAVRSTSTNSTVARS